MRERAIHYLARKDARQTSQLVFQALYSSMRKGWNKQEINESIARLNGVFPVHKIGGYRGGIFMPEKVRWCEMVQIRIV